MLLDRRVAPICQQTWLAGLVEYELTRYANEVTTAKGAEAQRKVGNAAKVKVDNLQIVPLSVFVQMLFNPDNMALERLTPVAFKVRSYSVSL